MELIDHVYSFMYKCENCLVSLKDKTIDDLCLNCVGCDSCDLMFKIPVYLKHSCQNTKDFGILFMMDRLRILPVLEEWLVNSSTVEVKLSLISEGNIHMSI